MKLKGLINNLTPVTDLYLLIYDVPENNCFYNDYFTGKEDIKSATQWKEIKDAKVLNAYIGRSEQHGMEATVYIERGRNE